MDLHDPMIILLKAVIQPRLPEPYCATSNSRAWIEVSNRFIEPESTLLSSHSQPNRPPEQRNYCATRVCSPRREQVFHYLPVEFSYRMRISARGTPANDSKPSAKIMSASLQASRK